MLKKIVTAGIILGTLTAHAATTGNLLLSGTVAEELAIVVTAEAGASNLDLSASPTALKVATVKSSPTVLKPAPKATALFVSPKT